MPASPKWTSSSAKAWPPWSVKIWTRPRGSSLASPRAPDFAEGWNKRATVRYLRGDYTGAIADCEETLARKPHHFGALSGQGLCHVALGQYHEAAGLFRRTLAVHPQLAAARQNLSAVLGEVMKGNGHAAGSR